MKYFIGAVLLIVACWFLYVNLRKLIRTIKERKAKKKEDEAERESVNKDATDGSDKA